MTGWVYYCDDGRGRIKIGYSVRPLSRLREFKTVNPEIEMVFRERRKGYEDRELEQKRHDQFKDDWIAGEWFHRSDRLDEWIRFNQAICVLKAVTMNEYSQ